MTSLRADDLASDDVAGQRAVFFVSDSTGITAQTLASALLAKFPEHAFVRHTIPFVDDEDAARRALDAIAAAGTGGTKPLVFTTISSTRLRRLVDAADAVVIDLLTQPLEVLEEELEAPAADKAGLFHSVDDSDRYLDRMRAVEYAIEHDDGQSARALHAADVIIVAPSRCGKTPTALYLALQHGLLVANYPLTDDDVGTDLPRLIAPYASRCFGLTTTPQRLSEVRSQRRPGSPYASLRQCAAEIRRAEELYRRYGIPYLNSATRSVEEMSAVIIQAMNLRA